MTEKITTEFIACGRRKTSIARVRMQAGTGTITVNGRTKDEYFPRPTLQMIIDQPFVISGTSGQYDVRVNVCGGGIAGQAGAIRHGISRALLEMNQDLRKPLKNESLLTRDAREKERRKVGCRKARRKPQFSKR